MMIRYINSLIAYYFALKWDSCSCFNDPESQLNHKLSPVLKNIFLYLEMEKTLKIGLK